MYIQLSQTRENDSMRAAFAAIRVANRTAFVKGGPGQRPCLCCVTKRITHIVLFTKMGSQVEGVNEGTPSRRSSSALKGGGGIGQYMLKQAEVSKYSRAVSTVPPRITNLVASRTPEPTALLDRGCSNDLKASMAYFTQY
jgi:hypothetical protein